MHVIDVMAVRDCYRWDVEIAWQSVHEILPPTLARVCVVSKAASATLMAGGRRCTGTQRPQSLSMAIGVRSCGMDLGIDTVDADPRAVIDNQRQAPRSPTPK